MLPSALRVSHALLASALVAAVLLAAVPGVATAQTKIAVPSLTFPTITNTADDIIKAKGLDKAAGLDVEIVPYGSVAGMYAGIAKAEIQIAVLAPFQVAKMRGQGVPLSVFATFVGMADTQIITTNPAIKSFADLKGHSLAATVGFSAWQYLVIYTKAIGMSLDTDLTLIDATTAMAQAQLEAGRVDAIQVWEPTSTRVLQQHPDARVIISGDQAWRQITGGPGWDIMLCVNTDWVSNHPGGLNRVLGMYQAVAAEMATNPGEADQIISSGAYTSKGIPPGTVATAIANKRLVAEVTPTWEPEANRQIWQMLDLGIKNGFIAGAEKTVVIGQSPGE